LGIIAPFTVNFILSGLNGAGLAIYNDTREKMFDIIDNKPVFASAFRVYLTGVDSVEVLEASPI
jgi:hypothetical protein